MPRPPIPRWCGHTPPWRAFKPVGTPLARIDVVHLGHDELEALRLCDYGGLDQEQAGASMGVSRGTIQRLLASGRAKVADALAHGKGLSITGGEHIQLPPGHHGHGRGRRGGRIDP